MKKYLLLALLLMVVLATNTAAAAYHFCCDTLPWQSEPRCGPCNRCVDGSCVPMPGPFWSCCDECLVDDECQQQVSTVPGAVATADVSIEVHTLMLIAGNCREVGLDRLGIRLTGCNQPELQTAGEAGEAHWHFRLGFGNGTHTVQWWNGDVSEWQPLLDSEGNPVTFYGQQLQLGETLQLGTVVLWNTCK